MDFRAYPLRLPHTLSDSVIRLDGHTLADAQAHWEGEDEEMMLRFDSPQRATLEQTRAAMGRWIDARAAGGPEFAYAIRQPSGVLMGGCATYLITPDRANVSYWVFPTFRGQGYAGRALALLCAAVAQAPSVEQIEAHVDADNIASRRVAEKAGFIETGAIAAESRTGALATRILYARPATRP